MTIGHRERVGLRKLGMQDNDTFKFYRWEVVGPDATKLTGCVCSGAVYRNGPRKGLPKYDGRMQDVIVTEAEEMAERARYETETGNCGACVGSGRIMKRWHHITGTEYRACDRCEGSGRLARLAAV